ncbi:peptidase [Niveispirillum lacus]|uniref:Peptidase n=1 Tax=Niveispirillum lacus TaxID=1981099 RepID=A0A255Z1J1_9PROT|nr:PepSY-associated TM helix domain-containing protein [Niveispirillum lacus]OYQ34775.1 peptidase [Niveispirillum lacus]
MKILDLLHRWAGGVLGLVLAILGLTGALLVHKDAWVWAPGAGDALVRDPDALADAVERIVSDPQRPDSIIFASDSFGLHRLRTGDGTGAYTDQTGAIVAQWQSIWDRPELWLFDLHHYLLAGDVGETFIGIVALVGLFFITSGLIMWWKLRRTFQFKLWPARLTRPSIIRHHRDIGVVLAPVLFLSCLTGAMLTLRPVADLVLRPLGPASEWRAATAPPLLKGGPLPDRPDWQGLFSAARAQFPDADFRVLSIPRQPGGLISLRLKQPGEWLPNGRTLVWFDPTDGRLIEARDALTMPAGQQAFMKVYPLHAAKVGGLPYRLVMTIAGLGMAMLGTLAVWTFWFRRPKKPAPITGTVNP